MRTQNLIGTLALGVALVCSPVCSPASAQDAPAAEPTDETSEGELAPLVERPAMPSAWLPDEPRCHRYRHVRWQVCDSPRRVPQVSDAAAPRAEELGLGTREAADSAWLGRVPESWTAHAGRTPDALLWPVATGLLARAFGAERVRRGYGGEHGGVDIVEAEGAHLRAVADGLVVYADNGIRGLGNVLFLVHADASVSIYAHCRALYVSPGEQVRRGRVVGELGRTGLAARAHLHYELRVNGVPRDPMPRFVERPDFSLRAEEEDDVRWEAAPPNIREDGEALASQESE